MAGSGSDGAIEPFDEQTKIRHQNARLLDRLLAEIPGITPQKLDRALHAQRAVRLHFSSEQETICRHIHGAIHRGHECRRHSQPGQLSASARVRHVSQWQYRKRLSGKQATDKHNFLKQKFPVTQKAAWETVWLPQPALMGDEEDMHEIAAAFQQDSAECERIR